VILMVAITVILAAVIGTFVLGLGDQVQETSPNAQYDSSAFTYDADDGSTDVVTGATGVVLTHQSGDAIAEDRIDITVDGVTAHGSGVGESDVYSDSGGVNNATAIWAGSDDKVTAGDSVAIVGADDDNTYSGSASVHTMGSSKLGLSGSTVRVVWSAEGGGQTSTLLKRDIN
jgi:FlaG/FlaF family flagellin (archaellin)